MQMFGFLIIIVWEFPQHRKHTHKAPQTLSASVKALTMKEFLGLRMQRYTLCFLSQQC